MAPAKSRIPEIVKKYEKELLAGWLEEQASSSSRQKLLMQEQELRQQCTEFLSLFAHALQAAPASGIDSPQWDQLREFLGNISRSRTQQGFSAAETASFVFSLKRPLMARLRKEVKNLDALADEDWAATELLDRLGLHTTAAYQKAREEVITRQQEEMMELSTPVVKLWDGILALPLIGTLDSARTQVVMEALLQRIVETSCSVAIIDITGVPTVDTLVAQHLLKTVTAARLMGADCIISGIRPQIAQTIVHLGVSLQNVSTKSSLADAFQLALQRAGLAVSRTLAPEPERSPA